MVSGRGMRRFCIVVRRRRGNDLELREPIHCVVMLGGGWGTADDLVWALCFPAFAPETRRKNGARNIFAVFGKNRACDTRSYAGWVAK